MQDAPKHLSRSSRIWWSTVKAEFELAAHHLRLLTLAAEAWDRAVEAREAIGRDGLTFRTRLGELRAHPAARIESESRIAFARLLRELALDLEPPTDSRPPALRGPRGGPRA